MEDGDVALLENVRFQPEEEANDPEIRPGAGEAGRYLRERRVRRRASRPRIDGRDREVRRRSAMGLLMEKELKYLHEELDNPAKPFRGHPGRLESLGQNRRAQSVDGKGRHDPDRRRDGEHIFQGEGIPIGASRVEADKLDLAQRDLSISRRQAA